MVFCSGVIKGFIVVFFWEKYLKTSRVAMLFRKCNF